MNFELSLQAQQEVPLWLEEYAKSSQSSAGFSNYGGKFGGRDIRKDQPKVNCLNNANYSTMLFFCVCKNCFYTPVFKTQRIMVYQCPTVRLFHMLCSNNPLANSLQISQSYWN